MIPKRELRRLANEDRKTGRELCLFVCSTYLPHIRPTNLVPDSTHTPPRPGSTKSAGGGAGASTSTDHSPGQYRAVEKKTKNTRIDPWQQRRLSLMPLGKTRAVADSQAGKL